MGKLLGEASARIKAGMSAAEVDGIYTQYGLKYSYDAAGRVASEQTRLTNRLAAGDLASLNGGLWKE